MDAPSPPAADRVRLPVLPAIGLVVLAIGIYANSFSNPFLIDDEDMFGDRPNLVAPETLGRLWVEDDKGDYALERNHYRPILVLTYHLHGRAVGFAPWALRLENVLVLAALAALAAFWLERHVGRAAAWMAAALVAAHPANTAVVDQVVGRGDLLSALGILIFLLLQRRAIDRGRWSIPALAGALAAVVLALGSKETGAIVLPLAAVQAWSKSRSPRRVHLAAAALVVLPLAAYVAARAAVVGSGTVFPSAQDDLTGNPLRLATMAGRIPAALSIAWKYVTLVVVPDTAFFHNPAAVPGWTAPTTYLGLAVLLAAGAVLAVLLVRRHPLAILPAWGLAQYAIVGNLLFPIGSYAANRLTIPLQIAIAGGAAWVLARSAGSSRARRSLAAAIWLVAVAGGAVEVARVNLRYASLLDVMAHEIEKHPDSPTSIFCHASALTDAGRLDEALDRIERVLAARPDSLQARYQKAGILQRQGREDEAIALYRQILDLAPDSLDAHVNLAGLALARKDVVAAQAHLADATRLAPTDHRVLQNLAVLAMLRGDFGGMVDRLLELRRHHPDLEHVRKALEEQARSFEAAADGNPGRAREWLELAVRAAPDVARYRVRLATFCPPEDAVIHLAAALRLDPGHVEAWLLRATMYRRLGQDNYAFSAYGRVIELAPDLDTPWIERGVLRARAGDDRAAIADWKRALPLVKNELRAEDLRREIRAAEARLARSGR